MNDVWLKSMREQYPPGSRIELREMQDPFHPVEPGTMGTLRSIDDMGTIHVDWDNGRRLGLVPGEDSFTVFPPKLEQFKLYMPLIAHQERGSGNEEVLQGSDLCKYEDLIRTAMEDNRESVEAERGIMYWYSEEDTIDSKVYSVQFTVEQRDGQLWGVAECKATTELTKNEMAILKEYIEGQASDGWGEGFEQQEIEAGGGGMYVHLWSTDREWKIMTEDEFMSQSNKENGIRVLYVQPGEYPEERIVKAELSEYQALVEGTIEVVYPWRDHACIVCNDEGKINGMPLNRELEDYDILAGPFFVCGLKDDDFCSLTDAQLQKYESLYHDPKVFTRTPMGIMSLPCTPDQYKAAMTKNGRADKGER